MAVVTVLQQHSRRAPWALTALNAMIAVGMVGAGDWVDQHLPLVSLGGHHVLVLWLSVAGFALLAGLAAVTGGFTAVGRRELVLLAVAGVVTTVAAAGALLVLSVLALAVPVVAVIGRVLR